jgi:hypothetical protein
MKCLEKNPEKRPADAAQFIRELENVEREIKGAAPVPPPSPKLPVPETQKMSSGWKFWKKQ